MRLLRPLTVLLLAGALLSGCGSSSSSSTVSSSGSSSSSAGSSSQAAAGLGPERVALEQGPPLAPASTTTPGSTVDAIQCAPVEQLAYHIHAHLMVYVDGKPRQLPPAIGLVGPFSEQTPRGPLYGARGCYYWLHTHAGDGVIHIESPSQRIYSLGNFFDEWRQPLSATQAAGQKGNVTAFVNGRRWTKNPRAIPLIPHAEVQLDVGAPVVAFQPVDWSPTGL